MLGNFFKFVGKYAGELRASVDIFSLILRALPIDPSDKRRAEETLEGLTAAADRIEASLTQVMKDGVIDRDDLKPIIREIVREMLPDIVGGITESKARKTVAKPRAAKPAAKPAAKGSTGA